MERITLFVNDEIAGWYGIYLMINEIRTKFSTFNEKSYYEIKNSLERWLISNAQNGDLDMSFSTMRHNNKLIDETSKYSKDVFNNVMDILSTFEVLPTDIPATFSIAVSPSLVNFYIGDFHFTLSTKRYHILSKYGSKEDIMSMILRHNSLLPGSQNWCVQKTVYKMIISKFLAKHPNGNVVECFASPLNAQVLNIKEEYPTANFFYCSILEKDKIFGSLGPFHQAIMPEGPLLLLVNPPFIENILVETVMQVEDILSKRASTCLFHGPSWVDAQFYQLLNKSKYLINTHTSKYDHEDFVNIQDCTISTHKNCKRANMINASNGECRIIKGGFLSTNWILQSK